ncbi:hypothetical protein OG866_08385 [Streptomyces sp. NBC_00663]|uniref:hypothetical protein n=1 Tax=Streptomyces sp. NBC_00663 TaxID=2975801 RepID=UPI002E37AA19|nr:hypothetical protein [Streptomyces sp. NBC_00663]
MKAGPSGSGGPFARQGAGAAVHRSLVEYLAELLTAGDTRVVHHRQGWTSLR